MITIKIHDAEWFRKHCRPGRRFHDALRPKGLRWRWYDRKRGMVYWLINGPMDTLVGKVLEVEDESKFITADEMHSTKYIAGGYYIPNWAIEWVKEEEDA